MSPFMKNELVVVAGGGGFIGGSLIAQLRRSGATKLRAVDVKPFDEWYQLFDGVENLRLDSQCGSGYPRGLLNRLWI
jgi:GDP-D-mannose 3',5'-epimerase